MKELTQTITIYPIHNESNINNIGGVRILSDDDIEFSEKVKSSDAGNYYEQTLSIYVDRHNYPMMSSILKIRYTIVALTDTDDKEYMWGDNNLPALMSITPSENKFKVDFSRKSTKSLFE